MPDFPNLFIVGAPKCATTTLHSILNLHPNIGMSNPKELNFFSNQDLSNQKLYYKDFRASSFKQYMTCFPLNDDYNYIGESSVSYFSYPNAHQKIYNHNSLSKIIVLLRNPVDRAFSHYLMDKRLGFVKTDFYEIFNEPEKYPSHYYQYFVLSKYYQPLLSLKTVFNNNLSIHILDGGESIAEIAKKIVKWLGISEFGTDVNFNNLEENTFFSSKYKVIRNFYQISWIRVLLKKIIPVSFQKNITQKLSSDKPLLEGKTRVALTKFFLEDINQLEELIGKDLSLWKKV